MKIGGRNINNLRYADDTVLLAETEEDLQNIVDQVKRESESFGLLMNAKKTKTMVFSKSSNPPNTRIHIEGKVIEKVQTFTYLGACYVLMTEDGRSEKEIKRRINIAKRTFQQESKLLTSHDLSCATKNTSSEMLRLGYFFIRLLDMDPDRVNREKDNSF